MYQLAGRINNQILRVKGLSCSEHKGWMLEQGFLVIEDNKQWIKSKLSCWFTNYNNVIR